MLAMLVIVSCVHALMIVVCTVQSSAIFKIVHGGHGMLSSSSLVNSVETAVLAGVPNTCYWNDPPGMVRYATAKVVVDRLKSMLGGSIDAKSCGVTIWYKSSSNTVSTGMAGPEAVLPAAYDEIRRLDQMYEACGM
ncbi:hypothetical protein K503DRAFT_787419 [Rhizopogon vinicolor AM-OR11-026]|uniref:Uncharacterized protein n=1 Tax=Rhizopogon vinicolor AM-OR11-026 TaxID=1314800 RepID=A0A1B7MHP7_9AGAM|nr:hypothetical protein K503DRAFT_787419 [Rhizopogon vinicolor AM-OR11-026]